MLINSCAPLLPKDTIRRAEDLSVALLCDGITKAGLDLPGGGCMCADIMPVNRTMKVVGTAITVETGEGNNFPIHVASYSVGLPGYIMAVSYTHLDVYKRQMQYCGPAENLIRMRM